MKLLDRVHQVEFLFQIANVLVGTVRGANLIVPNAHIDLCSETQPRVLEADPKELVLWKLLGGVSEHRSVLEPLASELPAIADIILQTYRNTDPEDYQCKVDLFDLIVRAQRDRLG